MRIRGKKFTFISERRRLPNGVVTRLEMIDYPQAAVILPFLGKDQIVFLRQFRAVFKKTLYELPAGTAAKDESPLSCAKRELPEETGYAAQKFTKLGFIYPVPGYSNEVIHIYKAEGLYPHALPKDVDEILKPVVLSVAQARKLFKQGRLPDGKTICALAFAGII
jgi:ADP-ribose pyrophosphatase